MPLASVELTPLFVLPNMSTKRMKTVAQWLYVDDTRGPEFKPGAIFPRKATGTT